MDWKTIACFLSDLEVEGAALDAAAGLAERCDAHLEVTCLGVDLTAPESFYAGAYALAPAAPLGLAEAEREATELSAAVTKRLEATGCRWSVNALATPILGLTPVVAEAVRFADVAVAAQPYAKGTGTAQVSAVEAALFGAGLPVIVVPETGLPASFKRVALAWNDSPEALRAARAGMALMAKAEGVEVLVVDPPRHAPDRSDPGGRLAGLLARHGARPSIRVLARTESSTAAILERTVREIGADLLVMGAYGHSRLRESILGGATRAMLESAKVPVLMMH